MDAVRRMQMLRLLEEQRGDLQYDRSHVKVGLARIEAEILQIEDAISELKSEGDD